jgi:hypothetical protein
MYGICKDNEKLWERNCSDIFKAAACVHFMELGAITRSRSEMRRVCHDVDTLVLDVKRI